MSEAGSDHGAFRHPLAVNRSNSFESVDPPMSPPSEVNATVPHPPVEIHPLEVTAKSKSYEILPGPNEVDIEIEREKQTAVVVSDSPVSGVQLEYQPVEEHPGEVNVRRESKTDSVETDVVDRRSATSSMRYSMMSQERSPSDIISISVKDSDAVDSAEDGSVFSIDHVEDTRLTFIQPSSNHNNVLGDDRLLRRQPSRLSNASLNSSVVSSTPPLFLCENESQLAEVERGTRESLIEAMEFQRAISRAQTPSLKKHRSGREAYAPDAQKSCDDFYERNFARDNELDDDGDDEKDEQEDDDVEKIGERKRSVAFANVDNGRHRPSLDHTFTPHPNKKVSMKKTQSFIAGASPRRVAKCLSIMWYNMLSCLCFNRDDDGTKIFTSDDSSDGSSSETSSSMESDTIYEKESFASKMKWCFVLFGLGVTCQWGYEMQLKKNLANKIFEMRILAKNRVVILDLVG